MAIGAFAAAMIAEIEELEMEEDERECEIYE